MSQPTALISVSDKAGLLPFARKLVDLGWSILSTGGTAKVLREGGIEVADVSSITDFPEILSGRVKTLHPHVHGAILWNREDANHRREAADHGIGSIDMVVVNLYPFRETIASGADAQTAVENIDIGGPAMVRAAAKNHASVSVVVDNDDYGWIGQSLEKDGTLSLANRRLLASKAYAHTASYDAAIASWFNQEMQLTFPQELSLSGQLTSTLRYGENPHQMAALYLDGTASVGAANASLLQGKPLSYNNLNDTDAAFEAVCEFDEPAVVIVKHANPCGVSIGDDLYDAYERAFSCDTVSAFGGIVALNRPLDGPTAERITQVFTEVIIAPEIQDGARAVLEAKKNLRVLETGGLANRPTASPKSAATFKSIAGGILVQSHDDGRIDPAKLETVTDRAPTDDELRDLLFAFKVAKHVKSNAIVYAKDQTTLGIGAGQMSRVDSSRIAAWKSEQVKEDALKGAVVASDAFFPFADGLEAAIRAGARAVIQPGGSKNDHEVIAAANRAGMAMVFTGMRHFRH